MRSTWAPPCTRPLVQPPKRFQQDWRPDSCACVAASSDACVYPSGLMPERFASGVDVLLHKHSSFLIWEAISSRFTGTSHFETWTQTLLGHSQKEWPPLKPQQSQPERGAGHVVSRGLSQTFVRSPVGTVSGLPTWRIQEDPGGRASHRPEVLGAPFQAATQLQTLLKTSSAPPPRELSSY